MREACWFSEKLTHFIAKIPTPVVLLIISLSTVPPQPGSGNCNKMPIINLVPCLGVERSEVMYVLATLWSCRLAGDVTSALILRLCIVAGHSNVQLPVAGCSGVPSAPITNNNVS